MNVALLTGFEPFGGEEINPSWEAVRALDGEIAGEYRIVARRLPCVFGEASEVLDGAIDELQPSLVLCVGQAGGRDRVCIERFGVNLADARIPDNRGAQPKGEPVVVDGPERYEVRIPATRIARAIRRRGIAAKVSLSAGRYVCNHVLYRLLHRIATQSPQLRGGFVHIPYSPEQAQRHAKKPPSMAIETVIEALRTAVAANGNYRAAPGVE